MKLSKAELLAARKEMRRLYLVYTKLVALIAASDADNPQHDERDQLQGELEELTKAEIDPAYVNLGSVVSNMIEKGGVLAMHPTKT